MLQAPVLAFLSWSFCIHYAFIILIVVPEQKPNVANVNNNISTIILAFAWHDLAIIIFSATVIKSKRMLPVFFQLETFIFRIINKSGKTHIQFGHEKEAPSLRILTRLKSKKARVSYRDLVSYNHVIEINNIMAVK